MSQFHFFPIFFTRKLNGDIYLDLLDNAVNRALIEIIDNDQRNHEENPICQHDKVPFPIMHYVDSSYWMKRFLVPTWPGRKGAIERRDLIFSEMINICHPARILIKFTEQITFKLQEITPGILHNVQLL